MVGTGRDILCHVVNGSIALLGEDILLFKEGDRLNTEPRPGPTKKRYSISLSMMLFQPDCLQKDRKEKTVKSWGGREGGAVHNAINCFIL